MDRTTLIFTALLIIWGGEVQAQSDSSEETSNFYFPETSVAGGNTEGGATDSIIVLDSMVSDTGGNKGNKASSRTDSGDVFLLNPDSLPDQESRTGSTTDSGVYLPHQDSNERRTARNQDPRTSSENETGQEGEVTPQTTPFIMDSIPDYMLQESSTQGEIDEALKSLRVINEDQYQLDPSKLIRRSPELDESDLSDIMISSKGGLLPLDSLFEEEKSVEKKLGDPILLKEIAGKRKKKDTLRSKGKHPIGKLVLMDHQQARRGLAPHVWDVSLVTTQASLVYDPTEKAYSCKVGLLFQKQSGEGPTNQDEITGFFSSSDSKIEPSNTVEMPLKAGAKPRLRKLISKSPSDTPKVRVHLEGDLQLEEKTLLVDPLELRLIAKEPRVLGFGLDSTRVDLSLPISSDSLNNKTFRPTLKIQRGPGDLQGGGTIKKALASNTLQASFRSEGVGETVIKASHPHFKDAKVKVVTLWPTYLIMIGLVGGLIGGAVRVIKRKSKAKGKAVGRLFIGTVTGFLLVAIVAIGLGEFGAHASLGTTRAGATVFALLGGYVGDGVFEWLGKRTGLTS